MKQVTIRRCPVCPSIRGHTDTVVDELKRDPNVSVRVVDGSKGEFTVEVDGKRVSTLSDETPPTVERVASAVRCEVGAWA
jgi:hypothetical protein